MISVRRPRAHLGPLAGHHAEVYRYYDNYKSPNQPRMRKRNLPFFDLPEHRGLTRGLQPWIAHIHNSYSYYMIVLSTPKSK